jgi:hypothetical protein
MAKTFLSNGEVTVRVETDDDKLFLKKVKEWHYKICREPINMRWKTKDAIFSFVGTDWLVHWVDQKTFHYLVWHLKTTGLGKFTHIVRKMVEEMVPIKLDTCKNTAENIVKVTQDNVNSINNKS